MVPLRPGLMLLRSPRYLQYLPAAMQSWEAIYPPPMSQPEPDYSDFAPQTYLRIRLRAASPEKVYFYTFLNHKRPVWYENLFIGKTDYFRGVVFAPPEGSLADGAG